MRWEGIGSLCLCHHAACPVLQAPDPAKLAVVLVVGWTCSSSLYTLYNRKAHSAVKQCHCFCCDFA